MNEWHATQRWKDVGYPGAERWCALPARPGLQVMVALDGFKAAPPAAEADLAPVQKLINEAYQGEPADLHWQAARQPAALDGSQCLACWQPVARQLGHTCVPPPPCCPLPWPPSADAVPSLDPAAARSY